MLSGVKFLGVSSKIFKVLAWIAGAVGIVSSLIIFIGGGVSNAPRATGFVGLLLGLTYFFIFTVASEVIALLLDIRAKVDKG